MLLKTRTFPAPSGVEKQPCYGVGRHSPVAAGGEADAAYLWAVGEAGAFELLGEEAAEEGAETFAGPIILMNYPSAGNHKCLWL